MFNLKDVKYYGYCQVFKECLPKRLILHQTINFIFWNYPLNIANIFVWNNSVYEAESFQKNMRYIQKQ